MSSRQATPGSSRPSRNSRDAPPPVLMWVDNAAKIYPAAKRRNWNNFFRLSATLTETMDVAVLRSALDVTVRRFPSIAVRLRIRLKVRMKI